MMNELNAPKASYPVSYQGHALAQGVGSNTLANERTAAQMVLDSIEQTKNSVQGLHERLSAICANLGCSFPPTDKQSSPRPVRGGIIGAIHDANDDVANMISHCHDLITNIARQV